MKREEIVDFENLYDSMNKCKKNVSWKTSTKHFTLNGIEECLKMEESLKSGTWTNGKPHEILITYPKKRQGLAISFKDRVYQRSLNDNELYPKMTNSFIYDNCACQKGKGTSFARQRLTTFIQRYYSKYGIEGYVLQIDIEKYYQSMDHTEVKNCFKYKLDSDVYKMTVDVLDTQYTGDTGYNPGSQMVQIAGISFLDKIDHYIKEQLHVKYYIRYMDDILIIHNDYDELCDILSSIEKELNKIKLNINKKKTHIKPLKEGFLFLGFVYRITRTGKIIKSLNGDNVKHEKRKLKKMAKKVLAGEMTKEKVDDCYRAWKDNASFGNSYKLLKRMDDYYERLWREEYGNS